MDQRRIQQKREQLMRLAQIFPNFGIDMNDFSDSDFDVNSQFIQTPQDYEQFVQEERQRRQREYQQFAQQEEERRRQQQQYQRYLEQQEEQRREAISTFFNEIKKNFYRISNAFFKKFFKNILCNLKKYFLIEFITKNLIEF
ncbi:hypothetical protein M9Y10_000558 [Tritrichomonas musculus]|uniref:Uncharacterized protein n=1 Tax=Tritrichomonas musculus TaxID=1915356 RepID=A0ABR2L4L9_9EUKA